MSGTTPAQTTVLVEQKERPRPARAPKRRVHLPRKVLAWQLALYAVLIVLALMFLGRQDRVMTRMTWAFTALVILSPIIQPWYLLWLLPFFAVLGIRDNWQIKWVVFTVGYFLAFGASDQLFTWQFLDIADQVKAVSLIVSAVCLLWILVVDRRTVRELPERDQVVIALYFFEGLTLAEIGQVLQVTESRVSQLRSRATRSLRERLTVALAT